jgi:catechol 2,3-dioxygenase-like lactoylglutathione lyase family enzyme
MIDHISLRVKDFDRALALYKAALAPLGYELVKHFPGFAGLGVEGKPDLWLTRSDRPINPTHVAFRADRATVDAFHAAGVAAGATSVGAPGVRPEYHAHYYCAFLADPDGNNIEAVCHTEPGAPRAARPAAAKKPAQKKAAARSAAPKKPAARKPATKKPAKKAKSAGKRR